ncbi:12056_t:CDS:2, partial [Ambispora gerdemannii]
SYKQSDCKSAFNAGLLAAIINATIGILITTYFVLVIISYRNLRAKQEATDEQSTNQVT